MAARRTERCVGRWQLRQLRDGGAVVADVGDGLVMVNGQLARLVTAAEAEAMDHVEVLARRATADQLSGACGGGCGVTVYWWPDMPVRPPKLCPRCARARRRQWRRNRAS